jgi:DNA gyrase/topoisomerase IV subunit B
MNDEQKLLKVNHEYDIDQIKALEQIEAVRVRPGMYIGSTSQSGIDQLVYEILDNSIDEYVAGCGTNISIKIFKDCSVEIADEGRGIPTGPHHIWKNKDGSPKDTLTGILTQLHAGGKFGGKDTGYKCFASDSLIYSDKGMKAIKNLSVNDKVLDCHNEFQSIKQIFQYEYIDNINTLSLSNGKTNNL